MEDAHLAEYKDPSIAVRNASSLALRPLMMAGELSAIMGEREVDPSGIRPVIPDAEKTAKAWIARTGIYPINHVLTLRNALLADHPWLAQELMELFEEGRRIAVQDDGAVPPPAYGLEANRASLQRAFDFSAEQQITERAYKVDELFCRI
jgi:4,5-dihydroxyphthalate decarboxylase